jgi:cell division protein DivIC
MVMVQKLIRFRYYIMFGAFLLWMLFFDSNNMFYRIAIARDISELKDMRALHVQALKDLNRQKAELSGNTANIEKFAREKYRMKRDNEDLFILVELPPEED